MLVNGQWSWTHKTYLSWSSRLDLEYKINSQQFKPCIIALETFRVTDDDSMMTRDDDDDDNDYDDDDDDYDDYDDDDDDYNDYNDA